MATDRRSSLGAALGGRLRVLKRCVYQKKEPFRIIQGFFGGGGCDVDEVDDVEKVVVADVDIDDIDDIDDVKDIEEISLKVQCFLFHVDGVTMIHPMPTRDPQHPTPQRGVTNMSIFHGNI